MSDSHLPIRSPEEYEACQRKLAAIDALAQQLEALYILAARNASRSGDETESDDAREDYFAALRMRQAIVNAIETYARENKLRG
jgi:hypothetical protein